MGNMDDLAELFGRAREEQPKKGSEEKDVKSFEKKGAKVVYGSGVDMDDIPKDAFSVGFGVSQIGDGLFVLNVLYRGEEMPLALFAGENEANLFSATLELVINSMKDD